MATVPRRGGAWEALGLRGGDGEGSPRGPRRGETPRGGPRILSKPPLPSSQRHPLPGRSVGGAAEATASCRHSGQGGRRLRRAEGRNDGADDEGEAADSAAGVAADAERVLPAGEAPVGLGTLLARFDPAAARLKSLPALRGVESVGAHYLHSSGRHVEEGTPKKRHDRQAHRRLRPAGGVGLPEVAVAEGHLLTVEGHEALVLERTALEVA